MYYDADWHVDELFHEDLVYQCRLFVDEDGVRRHQADREPGEVLYAGGLRDAAAVLDVPWEPTVGHWPDGDPFGERRIDAIKVTREVVPALRAVETARSASALKASDHAPVVVSFAPEAIAEVVRSRPSARSAR